MTDGLGGPPPPSSICAWRACGPWKPPLDRAPRQITAFTASVDPYGRIFEPLPPDVRARPIFLMIIERPKRSTRALGTGCLALRARFRYSSCDKLFERQSDVLL